VSAGTGAGRFSKPHERIVKFDICLGFDTFILDLTLLRILTMPGLLYFNVLAF
jgi:hypothetical protein